MVIKDHSTRTAVLGGYLKSVREKQKGRDCQRVEIAKG